MSDQATVTTPVSVFIPDLRVDGMYNEFTPAGETMKVVGISLISTELLQNPENYFW